MSETTNIDPNDFLNMLQKAKRQGAYETLNWLCWELNDNENENVTVKDVVDLLHRGIGAIGDLLRRDFEYEHLIDINLKEIIENRKKREKETGTE